MASNYIPWQQVQSHPVFQAMSPQQQAEFKTFYKSKYLPNKIGPNAEAAPRPGGGFGDFVGGIGHGLQHDSSLGMLNDVAHQGIGGLDQGEADSTANAIGRTVGGVLGDLPLMVASGGLAALGTGAAKAAIKEGAKVALKDMIKSQVRAPLRAAVKAGLQGAAGMALPGAVRGAAESINEKGTIDPAKVLESTAESAALGFASMGLGKAAGARAGASGVKATAAQLGTEAGVFTANTMKNTYDQTGDAGKAIASGFSPEAIAGNIGLPLAMHGAGKVVDKVRGKKADVPQAGKALDPESAMLEDLGSAPESMALVPVDAPTTQRIGKRFQLPAAQEPGAPIEAEGLLGLPEPSQIQAGPTPDEIARNERTRQAFEGQHLPQPPRVPEPVAQVEHEVLLKRLRQLHPDDLQTIDTARLPAELARLVEQVRQEKAIPLPAADWIPAPGDVRDPEAAFTQPAPHRDMTRRAPQDEGPKLLKAPDWMPAGPVPAVEEAIAEKGRRREEALSGQWDPETLRARAAERLERMTNEEFQKAEAEAIAPDSGAPAPVLEAVKAERARRDAGLMGTSKSVDGRTLKQIGQKPAEAPASQTQQQAPENVYLRMPLEQVKQDAAKGVKLAQEALRIRESDTSPSGKGFAELGSDLERRADEEGPQPRPTEAGEEPAGNSEAPKADKAADAPMKPEEAKAILEELDKLTQIYPRGNAGSREVPASVSHPELFAKAKQAREVLGKEPWQRPQQAVKRVLGMPEAKHRELVKKALEEGKTVPPEVLADYPDLVAEKPAEAPAPAAAPDKLSKLKLELQKMDGHGGLEHLNTAVQRANKILKAEGHPARYTIEPLTRDRFQLRVQGDEAGTLKGDAGSANHLIRQLIARHAEKPQEAPEASAEPPAAPDTPEEAPTLAEHGNEPVKVLTREDLHSFIQSAESDRTRQETVVLAPVSDRAVQAIKDATGIDVAGYTHVLDTDHVRHILKSHGKEATEGPRGQEPITAADIEKLPTIFENFDRVEDLGTDKLGHRRIRYEMEDNGTYFAVEVLRNKKRHLALNTFYKHGPEKETGATMPAEADPAGRTSETPPPPDTVTPSPQSFNSEDAAAQDLTVGSFRTEKDAIAAAKKLTEETGLLHQVRRKENGNGYYVDQTQVEGDRLPNKGMLPSLPLKDPLTNQKKSRLDPIKDARAIAERDRVLSEVDAALERLDGDQGGSGKATFKLGPATMKVPLERTALEGFRDRVEGLAKHLFLDERGEATVETALGAFLVPFVAAMKALKVAVHLSGRALKAFLKVSRMPFDRSAEGTLTGDRSSFSRDTTPAKAGEVRVWQHVKEAIANLTGSRDGKRQAIEGRRVEQIGKIRTAITRIRDAGDVAHVMSFLGARNAEHNYAVFVDATTGKLLEVFRDNIGDDRSVRVGLEDIIKEAQAVLPADRDVHLYLVHNHPNGRLRGDQRFHNLDTGETHDVPSKQVAAHMAKLSDADRAMFWKALGEAYNHDERLHVKDSVVISGNHWASYKLPDAQRIKGGIRLGSVKETALPEGLKAASGDVARSPAAATQPRDERGRFMEIRDKAIAGAADGAKKASRAMADKVAPLAEGQSRLERKFQERMSQPDVPEFLRFDKEGRWAKGKEGFQALTSLVTEKTTGVDWLDAAIEKGREWFLNDHDLPNVVKAYRRAALHTKRQILEDGRRTAELLERTLTPDEQKRAYQILTDRDAPAEVWDGLSSDTIKQQIITLGQKMVDLGLLSQEAVDRNVGKYLSRSYEKYEATTIPGATIFREFRLASDHLHARGRFIEFSPAKQQALKDTWTEVSRVGTGLKTLVTIRNERTGKTYELPLIQANDYLLGHGGFELRGNTLKRLQGMERKQVTSQAALKRALENGYEIEGGKSSLKVDERTVVGDRQMRILEKAGWIVEKVTNQEDADVNANTYRAWRLKKEQTAWVVAREGQRAFWRDWTKDEREAMGEIEHATFAVAKTFDQLAQSISSGQLFADIAKDTSLSSAEEVPGWVQMPEAKVPGTSTPKFGLLAGKYVEPATARYLLELKKTQEPSFWKPILTYWKLTKTSYNPVVHMNNIVTNMELLRRQGVNRLHLFEALADYLDKKSPMHQLALEHGVFGHDFAQIELRDFVNVERYRPKSADVHPASIAFNMLRALDKALGGGLTPLYQAEDHVFRLAMFKDRLERGMAPEMAAEEAIQGFIDYEISAPAINYLRNSWVPFIAYPYKAVPVLMEATMTRPVEAALLAATGFALYGIGKAWAQVNDQEEASIPDHVRGETPGFKDVGPGVSPLGMPRAYFLPWRDSAGMAQMLDARRWNPANVVEGNPLGGPAVSFLQAVLNKDMFFDQDIRNPNTPWIRQVADTALWLGTQFLPPLTPGVGYQAGRVGQAITGEADSMGRTRTWGQALGGFLGLKVTGLDVDALALRKMAKARAQINDAEDVIRRAGRAAERTGNYKRFERVRDEQVALIHQLEQELNEYLAKTQPPATTPAKATR